MLLKWQAALLICGATCAAAKRKQKVEPIRPEHIHNPLKYVPYSPFVNDTDYKIDPKHTPDWRYEEQPMTAWKENYYHEEEKPYRLSPYFKQIYRWRKARYFGERQHKDNPQLLGCYCCTVFKRLTPLGTCAVITTRHVLTTATSTELVLKDYDNKKSLEDILGIWYDVDANVHNSSMYITPARIHYHPKYVMPDSVNASHPLPCMFDLAVWATTYPFKGWWIGTGALVCQRAGSHRWSYGTPYLEWQTASIVGFQFMWWYKRVPMPWFKYVIKTKKFKQVCPKSEWGWFFCVGGRWAQLGIDSGMALHRNSRNKGWRYDGLLGVGSFSMSLRSDGLMHYFTPVECHAVLDFLYLTYLGRLPYRYLDYRFYNTQGRAPIPKPWFYIPMKYDIGENNFLYKDPPFN